MTTDLRLGPSAVVAWVVAAVGVGLGARTVLASCAVAVVLVGCLVAVAVQRRARGGGRRILAQTLAIGGCVVAVLTSTGVHAALRAGSGIEALAEQHATVTVRGTVDSAPVPRPTAFGPPVFRVVLDAEMTTARGVRARAIGPVAVVGEGAWATVVYGSRVEATGRLALVNGDVLLRARGGPTLVGRAPAPLRAVHTIRTDFLAATDGLPSQARGLVPGVAVGDTSRLAPELDAALRATSLTHITAVSGGHFAVIVAVVAASCAALRASRVLRVLVTGSAMVAFVALVHPQPSVLRAAVMGGVGLVALLLRRPGQAMPALGATAISLLIADPWLARSYGFVLSVVATGGIVLMTAPIAAWLRPWCGRILAHLVAVPTAAQLACAPILILLDPAVAVYGVPANLLAAPALGPATVLGVLSALVAPVHAPAATALGWLAGLFTGWIAMVATVLAALPGARLPWVPGTAGVLLLAGTTVAAGALLWHRRRSGHLYGSTRRSEAADTAPARGPRPGARRMLAVVVVALLAVGLRVAVVHREAGPPDDWLIVGCDVGQGDSLVLRAGAESAVVLDVGPSGDAADACLDALGVRRIDLLVLTHFHADHVGGLGAVLAGRTVSRALVSGLEEPEDQAGAVRRLLADAGVDTDVALAGESGRAGDVAWEVLQSGRGGDAGRADRAGAGEGSGANDASVVLRAQVGGLSVVALGDLEEPGQERLARSWEVRDDGPVDVVKVAHHGSAAQSDRLAALLGPRVAVVSSGENMYGHPTDRALDLYRRVGAVVVRTDTCGTFGLVRRPDGIGLAGCGAG